MKTKLLGSSDLSVPILCIGSMTWGQQNSESEAHEQLTYAVDERGLNFIDTAEIYPIPPDPKKQGQTETFIGNWLHRRGKRDDLILATKVAVGREIRTRDTGSKPRYDRKSIRDAIEGSLQRLQTSYIDLYQVHFPERKTNFFGIRGYTGDDSEDTTPIEETLSALSELVKEGKVRYIGVSNETPWGVSEYLRLAREKGYEKIVSIQNQYSLLNRTYEIGLSEITLKNDVGLLAYSPLNMGALSGKYLHGTKPEGARFTLYERNQERYNPARAQAAIERYVSLAHAQGLDPAQMALAFVMSRPFMTSVIMGTTSVEQLKANIDAAEITLSTDILEEIEAIYRNFPDPTH